MRRWLPQIANEDPAAFATSDLVIDQTIQYSASMWLHRCPCLCSRTLDSIRFQRASPDLQLPCTDCSGAETETLCPTSREYCRRCHSLRIRKSIEPLILLPYVIASQPVADRALQALGNQIPLNTGYVLLFGSDVIKARQRLVELAQFSVQFCNLKPVR